MRTRFAPSPTGLLHLGHAYAAKYAYDMAREHDGEFLLRFEDIDITRVRDQYYLKIERDLTWLGFSWYDTPLRQMNRLSVYAQALEDLKSLQVVYPCFCTRKAIQKEIAAMGGAPHLNPSGEGPLYPGTCRAAAKQIGSLYFMDSIHGKIQVNPLLLGDVVLARKDIATSYHLAVVIDDATQGITDVTRGEDLLSSTHVHCTLQSLLNLETPSYHHHRLIMDDTHKRLAKRDQAMSIQALRDQQKTAEQVLDMIR